MPTIDLTDDEQAAVTEAVRRTIDEDRYPLALRLAPLRSALAKLDPTSAPKLIARPGRGRRRARASAIGGARGGSELRRERFG